MRFDDLHDGNINLYSMKFYDNPQCNDELEYYEDLKKITYILETGQLSIFMFTQSEN